MWTISVPLAVALNKKETNWFTLNLNAYRNANFHTLNNAKIAFKDRVSPLFKNIPKLNGCTLEFTLFPGSNIKCDVSNICSIVEKFFNDAFVECGKLDDDNYTFVPTSRYNFGGVDKINPRVEVTITPIKKEEIMQITLVQTEIEQAIADFVRSQISVKDGHEVNIELKATRGDAGMQAVVNIVPQGSVVAQAEAQKPAVVASKGLNIAKTVVAAKQPEPEQQNLPGENEKPVVDPQEQTPPAEDPEPEVPVTPAKSLFAGLSKPKNA